jgi:hypothetical protein
VYGDIFSAPFNYSMVIFRHNILAYVYGDIITRWSSFKITDVKYTVVMVLQQFFEIARQLSTVNFPLENNFLIQLFNYNFPRWSPYSQSSMVHFFCQPVISHLTTRIKKYTSDLIYRATSVCIYTTYLAHSAPPHGHWRTIIFYQ